MSDEMITETATQKESQKLDKLTDDLSSYVRAIKKFPMLEKDEEYMLAKDWLHSQDAKVADKLINSHLRLVLKIASGYTGYGLPLKDLVAEGNIGMMKALKGFDPEKGNRLSTYAKWWIKSAIHSYVMDTLSIVKFSQTPAQKKLSFSLRRKLSEMKQEKGTSTFTIDDFEVIAKDLDVPVKDVKLMYRRLRAKDASLNVSIGNADDSQMEWQDWIEDERENQDQELSRRDEFDKRHTLLLEALKVLNEREAAIIQARRLKEPPEKLEQLAQQLSLSRERVRQLEEKAFSKLQKTMRNAAYKQGY